METFASAVSWSFGSVVMRPTVPDATRARDYYSRALAAGVGAARDRIAARESQQN